MELNYETELLGLLIALAVGLIIGFERGWRSQNLDTERHEEVDDQTVTGIRTFGLLGLSGGVVAQLARTSANVIGRRAGGKPVEAAARARDASVLARAASVMFLDSVRCFVRTLYRSSAPAVSCAPSGTQFRAAPDTYQTASRRSRTPTVAA